MNIEEFIATQIETVDHLRVLLLLQSSSPTTWAALEISGKLYLPEPVSAAVLAQLAAKGLLTGEGVPVRYGYQPRTPELAELVRQLVELDRKRPVTLINRIYGRPTDLQTFADAFKLKKEKGN